MARPNFFIIGAPKCGTTSLAAWLSKHRQVFMPSIKEPHHFNTDMEHRVIVDRQAYDALFDPADECIRIGEASVWYLFSQMAVPNLEREFPGAKYIVCIRSQVEMAYSLYHQQVFSGSETAPTFEDAWDSATSRKQGKDVPRHALDPQTIIYPKVCSMGEQITRLLTHVPAERLFVLDLADMIASPRASFENVQHFLDLEIDDSVPLLAENSAKVRRSDRVLHWMRTAGRVKRALGIDRSLGLLTGIDRINRKQAPYPPMAEETRDRLSEFFSADTDRLEAALGRSFVDWRKT